MTGADSGIGRAIALTFAREGGDVAIHAFGDRRGAERTVHAIEAHGHRSAPFEADLSNPAAAEGLIAKVVARLGRLDIRVDNAGRGSSIPTYRPGETQVMANIALFLASDEASYVTGTTFYVDGGLMLRMGAGGRSSRGRLARRVQNARRLPLPKGLGTLQRRGAFV